MVNKIYDGVLGVWAGVAGAQAGTAYKVEPSTRGERVTLGYNVTMSNGTGTWILEGRNHPSENFVQIATGTASGQGTCAAFRELRLRWTAATGLTARGSVNAVLRP
jgi:hypothetical protein